MEDYTAIIHDSLSMTDVAIKYGFEPNRGGFIPCPFHGEKTASLKIYEEVGRGWHCFGCGEGGDVIDFVRRLFGDTFKQALERINADFVLGLRLDEPPDKREVNKLRLERKRREAEKAAYNHEFDLNCERYRKCILWLKCHNPSTNEALYAKALKLRTYLELYFETERFKR